MHSKINPPTMMSELTESTFLSCCFGTENCCNNKASTTYLTKNNEDLQQESNQIPEQEIDDEGIVISIPSSNQDHQKEETQNLCIHCPVNTDALGSLFCQNSTNNNAAFHYDEISQVNGYALICMLPDLSMFKGFAIEDIIMKGRHFCDSLETTKIMNDDGMMSKQESAEIYAKLLRKLLNPLSHLSLHEILDQSYDYKSRGYPFPIHSFKGWKCLPTPNNSSPISSSPKNNLKTPTPNSTLENDVTTINHVNIIGDYDQSVSFALKVATIDDMHNYDYGIVCANQQALLAVNDGSSLSSEALKISKQPRVSVDRSIAPITRKLSTLTIPKNVSSPEISSTYRQKRFSLTNIENVNRVENSSFRKLLIEGKHFKFQPNVIYTADQANIIISKAFRKDLIGKGCFILGGSFVMRDASAFDTHHNDIALNCAYNNYKNYAQLNSTLNNDLKFSNTLSSIDESSVYGLEPIHFVDGVFKNPYYQYVKPQHVMMHSDNTAKCHNGNENYKNNFDNISHTDSGIAHDESNRTHLCSDFHSNTINFDTLNTSDNNEYRYMSRKRRFPKFV